MPDESKRDQSCEGHWNEREFRLFAELRQKGSDSEVETFLVHLHVTWRSKRKASKEILHDEQEHMCTNFCKSPNRNARQTLPQTFSDVPVYLAYILES